MIADELIASELKSLRARVAQLEALEVPISQQGTFTPIFFGSTIAGTFTYVVQSGQYVRLGGVCFFAAQINISAITVAPTGALQISLPLTAGAAARRGNFAISDYTGITLGAGYSQLGARVISSTAYAQLIKSGSAIQALTLAGGALALIAGAAEIEYSGMYWLD